MSKKLIAVICAITLMFVCSANVLASTPKDISPAVWLQQPIWEDVELNGTTGYVLAINGADEINLTPKNIILNGFTANVSIHPLNNNKYLILLSNIVGHAGEKTIGIKEGIATKGNGVSYPISESFPFYLEGLTWYVSGPSEFNVGDVVNIEITSDCVFDWTPSESDFLNFIDSALEFEKVTVEKSKCIITAKAKAVGALSLVFSNGGYNSNTYEFVINSGE